MARTQPPTIGQAPLRESRGFQTFRTALTAEGRAAMARAHMAGRNVRAFELLCALSAMSAASKPAEHRSVRLASATCSAAMLQRFTCKSPEIDLALAAKQTKPGVPDVEYAPSTLDPRLITNLEEIGKAGAYEAHIDETAAILRASKHIASIRPGVGSPHNVADTFDRVEAVIRGAEVALDATVLLNRW